MKRANTGKTESYYVFNFKTANVSVAEAENLVNNTKCRKKGAVEYFDSLEQGLAVKEMVAKSKKRFFVLSREYHQRQLIKTTKVGRKASNKPTKVVRYLCELSKNSDSEFVTLVKLE